MKKTKSIIFELYNPNEQTKPRAMSDFRILCDMISKDLHKKYYSYKLRVDEGNYHFMPNGVISLTEQPRIHLIIESKDKEITKLSELFERRLSRFRFCTYDKMSYEDDTLNKHNHELFDKYSKQKEIYEVKYKERGHQLVVKILS